MVRLTAMVPTPLPVIHSTSKTASGADEPMVAQNKQRTMAQPVIGDQPNRMLEVATFSRTPPDYEQWWEANHHYKQNSRQSQTSHLASDLPKCQGLSTGAPGKQWGELQHSACTGPQVKPLQTAGQYRDTVGQTTAGGISRYTTTARNTKNPTTTSHFEPWGPHAGNRSMVWGPRTMRHRCIQKKTNGADATSVIHRKRQAQANKDTNSQTNPAPATIDPGHRQHIVTPWVTIQNYGHNWTTVSGPTSRTTKTKTIGKPPTRSWLRYLRQTK